MAGADVVLTDLPHITPLTQENVEANCRQTVHRAQVLIAMTYNSIDPWLRPQSVA
jgi:hypothetical protein